MSGVRRGALLLVVAALVAGCSSSPSAAPSPTAPASAPAGKPALPSPATPTSRALPTADDPRFLDAQEGLAGSVVEIVQRPNRFVVWRQVCTGAKVGYAGRRFVVTAQHCVRGLLDGKVVDRRTGTDVTDRLRAELGVRVAGSVASVRRVVVRRYPDVAVLEVARSSRYDAVPALDVGDGLPPGHEGAPAFAAGLPAAAGGRLATGVGEYLGRVQDPSDPDQLLDLVGLDVRTPSRDACNYGASGALGLVAPSYVLGPLAVRNNVVNPAGSNGDDDPAVDRKNRVVMAEQLGRSLAGYPTICGYAELSRSILDSLLP